MDNSLSLTTDRLRSDQYSKASGYLGLLRATGLGILCLLAGCASYPQPWISYKDTFLEEGRIIDTGNNDISHSEGQGYGLLLALLFDDQESFKEIWQWTKSQLQIRKDALFAWKWEKTENHNYQVTDKNNATDGDLLIALALSLAAKQWRQDTYMEESNKISSAILKHLTLSVGQDQWVLLPAEYGFQKEQNIAFNPSYQILKAYQVLAASPDQSQWHQISRTAEKFIYSSLNPATRLPPDWITFNYQKQTFGNELNTHWPTKRNYFGDEAIRVFLYQLWKPKLVLEPTYLFREFESTGQISRFIESETSETSKEALAGYYAILAINASRLGKDRLAQALLERAQQKLESEKGDYYSHTLYLLAIMSDQQVLL